MLYDKRWVEEQVVGYICHHDVFDSIKSIGRDWGGGFCESCRCMYVYFDKKKSTYTNLELYLL